MDFNHQICATAQSNKFMHSCLIHFQLHHHGHAFGNRETGIIRTIAFQRASQSRSCDWLIGNVEVAIFGWIWFRRGTAHAATTHVSHAHVHVHVRHSFHAHAHPTIGTCCFSWLGNISGRRAD